MVEWPRPGLIYLSAVLTPQPHANETRREWTTGHRTTMTSAIRLTADLNITPQIQAHTSRGCPIHEAARSWRAARSPGTSSPPTCGRAAPLCRSQSAAPRPSAAHQHAFGHRRRRASRARRRRQRHARRPSARRRLARCACRAGSPAPGSCGAQGGAQTTAHSDRREGGRRGQSMKPEAECRMKVPACAMRDHQKRRKKRCTSEVTPGRAKVCAHEQSAFPLRIVAVASADSP